MGTWTWDKAQFLSCMCRPILCVGLAEIAFEMLDSCNEAVCSNATVFKVPRKFFFLLTK